MKIINTITSLFLVLIQLTNAGFVPENNNPKYFLSIENGIQPISFSEEMFPCTKVRENDQDKILELKFQIPGQNGILFLKNPSNTNTEAFETNDLIRFVNENYPNIFGKKLVPQSENITNVFEFLDFRKKTAKTPTNFKYPIPALINFLSYEDEGVEIMNLYAASFSNKSVMDLINAQNKVNLKLNSVSGSVTAETLKESNAKWISEGIKQLIINPIQKILPPVFDFEEDFQKIFDDMAKEIYELNFMEDFTERLSNEDFLNLVQSVLNREKGMNLLVSTAMDLHYSTLTMVGMDKEIDSVDKDIESQFAVDKLYFGLFNLVFEQWFIQDSFVATGFSEKVIKIVQNSVQKMLADEYTQNLDEEVSDFLSMNQHFLYPNNLNYFLSQHRAELFYYFEQNKAEIRVFLNNYYNQAHNVEAFTKIFAEPETGVLNHELAFNVKQYLNPFMPPYTAIPYSEEKTRRNLVLV